MGPSRRMQKQGMPEVVSDARIAAIKRKRAGEPAPDTRGKKRSAPADVVEPPPKKKTANGKAPVAGKSKGKSTPRGSAVTGAAAVANLKTKSKAAPVGKKSKKQPEPAPQEDSDVVSDDDALDFMDASGDESMDSLEDEEIDLDNDGGILSGSSVVDSDEDRGLFSEDDDSDAEEVLNAANIEGLSAKLDAEQAAEAAQAQLELEEAALQTNIAGGDRPRILPGDDSDSEEPATNLALAPDLQLLRTRITDTIRVLDDFSKLSEPGRSRAEYTAQLEKDICAYYGYSPYLANKLMNLFSPREAFDFFEANESPRPVVLRTNSLKTHRRELAQSLISRGVNLQPVGKWSKVGLQVFDSQVPLGATPEYLGGHYIIQAASSFLPVMALAPQENERILDMASAPGGKATHMSALMRNTGIIVANDSNKARSKSLIGNYHRLGAKNIVVSNYDARAFPNVMGGFDRVLLDAPCSGTGVIAKDPSVKTNKTERDFLALPHLQKQLLLGAVDSVKTGGHVVYSTCSVTVEENEGVVQYLLRKRPNVKIVDSGLTFGVEGFTSYMGKTFDQKMKLSRRYYPHTYNVDGFYVCKLKKTGPSPQQKPGEANGAANGATNGDDDVPIDKTPIGEEEAEFGGWDEDEDQAYIEKAKKRNLKRKGLNPKSDKSAAAGKANGKST